MCLLSSAHTISRISLLPTAMLRIIWGLPVVIGLSLAQATPTPVVDLGYAKYQGYYNSDYDQNIFKGIRYAAPPVGKLRWQMPQPPATNRSEVLSAVDFAPICPQGNANSPSQPVPVPSGDEDCLFLNIAAPSKGERLPVLVWIHGGGYGLGSNRFDNLMQQIRTNGNSYIAVSIAYRLGAFGFLSSKEVEKFGVLNAALHDQRFALQWIKNNIHHFGGDPGRVTISGVSAGGGSVMLQAMANNGREGDALFQGAIASSPYLPTQWNFDDAWPTLSYQAFVDQAGCSDAEVPFECLQSADTLVLQNASSLVSASGDYGQWAFIPVTDGKLIRKRPTEQLVINKKVNGLRLLTGNNENEAPGFTPQNITTKEEFISFVLTSYPRLSQQNLTRVLELYTVPENASKIYADSDGIHPPFSTTNSNWAIGWQQAANNLYAETTFVCPSYWLADAFGGARGKRSWKYQYSVPISAHGADIGPLFDDPNTQGTGLDMVFRTAFQQIWGNFIVNGDPTLSTAQVSTAQQGNITAASTGNWPQWGGRPERGHMLNLNMTGGMPVDNPNQVGGKTLDLTSYVPSTDGSYPELEASFKLVSGWSWEGGRGKRCQLWVDLGPWALE
ncbi:carboxylesterase family protein [Xylaria scruposa]|nr:carboxylesterase family protein [Xylaria scruposa]